MLSRVTGPPFFAAILSGRIDRPLFMLRGARSPPLKLPFPPWIAGMVRHAGVFLLAPSQYGTLLNGTSLTVDFLQSSAKSSRSPTYRPSYPYGWWRA